MIGTSVPPTLSFVDQTAPDLDGLPYEHLVGLVTIGTSSLDHVIRLLHAMTLVDAPADTSPDTDPWDLVNTVLARKELSKALRQGWRIGVENEAMTGQDMLAGTTWLHAALDLLDRRDTVAHALWEADPDLPEGLRGRHLRSRQHAPDLAGIRELARAVHTHLADDRLRIIAEAIKAARWPDAP